MQQPVPIDVQSVQCMDVQQEMLTSVVLNYICCWQQVAGFDQVISVGRKFFRSIGESSTIMLDDEWFCFNNFLFDLPFSYLCQSSRIISLWSDNKLDNAKRGIPSQGGQIWPWPLIPWPKINRVPPLIIHKLPCEVWKWMGKNCSLYAYKVL